MPTLNLAVAFEIEVAIMARVVQVVPSILSTMFLGPYLGGAMDINDVTTQVIGVGNTTNLSVVLLGSRADVISDALTTPLESLMALISASCVFLLRTEGPLLSLMIE